MGAGAGISVAADSVAVDTTVMRNNSDQTLVGQLIVSDNSGVTGSSAPTYTQANIELYTSSNHVPALSFHRSGYSATTLYEYDGQLYANAWTTRAQTGLLLSSGNIGSYAWTSSNDGSGTGLDSDLLDGQHGSYYLNYNNFSNTPSIPSVGNGTITINQAGSQVAQFTVNQSGNTTVNLTDNNTDTNTTYSAGTGLSLNGTTFSIAGTGSLITNLLNVNTIVANNIDANAITAEKISSGSITAEELAISNNASGSAGIYFSTTAIEIRDASRVRVKIGAL